MRFVFLSDVHGEYAEMVDALRRVNFDWRKDTIVSVGDPFDRGPHSREVLRFLLACPHHILIWGNHDMRLNQLIEKWGPDANLQKYDIENGILKTLESFLDEEKITSPATALLRVYEKVPELNRYFKECVYAAEWKNLIATHAWLPVYDDTDYSPAYKPLSPYKFTLRFDWRDIKVGKRNYWYDVMWCDTKKIAQCPEAYPEKPLLVGHYHAWRLAQFFGEERVYDTGINCRTFERSQGRCHLIAIDGCCNYKCGGLVNVYVMETDEEPILYR